MIKTETDAIEQVICYECNEEIYKCDDCKEYFYPNQIIFCDSKNNKHLCENCGNDKLRKTKSENYKKLVLNET